MGVVATHPVPADDATPAPVEGVTVPSRPIARLDEGRCSVRALARGDSAVATASPAPLP